MESNSACNNAPEGNCTFRLLAIALSSFLALFVMLPATYAGVLVGRGFCSIVGRGAAECATYDGIALIPLMVPFIIGTILRCTYPLQFALRAWLIVSALTAAALSYLLQGVSGVGGLVLAIVAALAVGILLMDLRKRLRT